MKPEISNAILALHPTNSFTLRDNNYDQIEWANAPESPSTKKQVEDKLAELQAEYDAQEYARNRKEEYDQLNQFELISDDDVNGTTTHKDAIAAIKTKWPKDNSGPVE